MILGIQPTYEELKRDSVAEVIADFFGIQPTYEELKRVDFYSASFRSRRIQPTYEELKQARNGYHRKHPARYPAYL